MGGVFANVKVQDMTDKIAFWEAASRGEVEKLASLLCNVISAVRKSGAGQAVVECTGGVESTGGHWAWKASAA